MGVNKIVFGDNSNVLIDLTDLDVTAGDVVSGVTFIMRDGTKAVGTITIPTNISDLNDDVGLVTHDNSGNVSIAGTMTVEGHSSAIGDYYRLDGTHSSFTSGTSYTQLKDTTDSFYASFTLGKGIYVVVGEARFTGNTSGYRGIELHMSSGNVLGSQVLVPPYSSASVQTRIQTVCVIEVTTTTDNVDLYAVQNSGSALNVAWGFRATRIA